MNTLALTPRQPVPALNIPLVGGGRYVLGATPAATFDLVVFYRGLHCPICAKYLMELERLMPEFRKARRPGCRCQQRQRRARPGDG